MNWIDITKELPALGIPVLVKWRGDGITAAMPHAPGYGPRHKIWFDTYGVIGPDRDWEWCDSGDPFWGVTHWMLMPADPVDPAPKPA